ncbi:peptidyl-alpha-hydroxyglycine alpha-amidating lyase 2-like isoform X1 [Physella acuta]|uniref:peptidyl-alpha-hydroxyglycine alpha-amidating lyase 2-like isoform X1 n=1 Tax=Physella acuta TaxID=109671 RepID=UPI0027DBE686|nr:peptidyl-alpha-hydroxyglycine alpha-amidating lyase 2-like isoform X1 [Physella acuta]
MFLKTFIQLCLTSVVLGSVINNPNVRVFKRVVDQQPILPVEVTNFSTDGQGIGPVTGIDLDSNGDLFVFHSGDRSWNASTFKRGSNVLSNAALVPINQDTIYRVDPNTGRRLSSFGKDFFNMPHGLKIDSQDNIWVTDAGRHQVFRFKKGATTPDLELGVKFVPGSDDKHFCKPADVAIASSGEFFVADGYCNSRIIKFSSSGQVISKWGVPLNRAVSPYTLNIAHSITLVEELDLVCVADRESSRANCYNAGLKGGTTGIFNRTIIPQNQAGKIYAVYYSKADRAIIAAGVTSQTPISYWGRVTYPPRAYTYSLTGQQIMAWAHITPTIAKYGESLIHDLCTSPDGQDLFLADLDQHRVYKYTYRVQ